MATRTEELRTVIKWDVTEVDTSSRKVERGFKRIMESENKVKRNLSGFAQDLVNVRSGSDIAAAGLNRLSDVFKMGGAMSVGVAVAIAGYSVLTDKARALAEMQSKLESSAEASNRAMSGSGSHDSMSTILAKADRAKQVIADANALIEKIDPAHRSAAGRAADNAVAWANNTTVEQMMQGAELRRSLAAKQLAKARRDITASLEREVEIVEMLRKGDTTAARMKQINLAEDQEIAAAKENELSNNQKNFDLIRRKYAVLRAEAQQTEEISEAQETSARKQRVLAQSQMGVYKNQRQIKMELLKIQLEEAKAIMAASPEGSDTHKKAHGRAQDIQLQMDLTSKEGFVGKSERQIRAMMRKQQREDRKAQKDLTAFNRRGGMVGVHRGMDGQVVGGVDPATGQRTGGYGASIGGANWFQDRQMQAGGRALGLGSKGGLTTGGLGGPTSDKAWRETFPAKGQQAPANGVREPGQNSAQTTLSDIRDSLRQIAAKQLA